MEMCWHYHLIVAMHLTRLLQWYAKRDQRNQRMGDSEAWTPVAPLIFLRLPSPGGGN